MSAQRPHIKVDAANCLCLAAAPTFAIMALLTAVSSGPMLCSAAPDLPLNGMTPMYLMMAAFHLSPWLRWLSVRRTDAMELGEAPAPHI